MKNISCVASQINDRAISILTFFKACLVACRESFLSLTKQKKKSYKFSFIFLTFFAFSSLFAQTYSNGTNYLYNGSYYTLRFVSSYINGPSDGDCVYWQAYKPIPDTTVWQENGNTHMLDVYCGGNYPVYHSYDLYLTGSSSCPSGTVLNSSNFCIVPCTSDQYRDSNGVCEYDYSKLLPFMHQGNDYLYHYPDHTSQYCSLTTQTCTSFDPSGNVIPNIPINGITYNSNSDLTARRFALLGGVGIALTTGGIALLTESLASAVATATTGAVFGLALSTGGAAFVGNVPYILNDSQNSNTNNSLSVKMMTESQFQAVSGVTSSTATNGDTVQTQSLSSGGSQVLETSPTTGMTSAANINPDGSATVVSIPTASLTPAVANNLSSVNNQPTTTYTVSTVPSPSFSPNGSPLPSKVTTDTWSVDSANHSTWISSNSGYPSGDDLLGRVVSSSSSSTFGNVGTTSTTTAKGTSTTTPDGNITSSQSSSTDLSAITSRLDRMINQASVTGKIDLDDGTSKFGDVQNTLTNGLSVTSGQGDILGLNIGQYQLQQYSFNILNHKFVIFDPSMMNNIPVNDIRALLFMIAAISGFISIFRTI